MSTTTIDAIAIEIDSSAIDTSKGIDSLVSSLTKLKDASKLKETTSQLSKLATALSGLSAASKSMGDLSNIANQINKLSAVKDLKNLNTAVNALRKMPNALNGLQTINVGAASEQMIGLTSALGSLKTVEKGGIGPVINQLKKKVPELVEVFSGASVDNSVVNIKRFSEGLKSMQGLEKGNVGSLLNQLKKIPEIASSLDTKTIATFGEHIQHLTTVMQPLAAEMSQVAAGFNVLPKNINRAITTLDNFNKSADKTQKKLKTQGSLLGGLRLKWLAYSYGVMKAAQALASMFTDFTERYETMNLAAVAFGDYTQKAYNYAQLVQDSLGVNAGEWLRYQAVFMQLGNGFGLAADEAYEMSKGLTEVSYDIASLFNLDLEEAFTKVQSGISGELEPLRRLGYDLSQTKLQEIATANGIQKKVAAMTQAEKAELRYLAITEQMPNVIGDMARTIVSPANALRVLKSEFQLLSQTMGALISVVVAKFIPVFQALTKVLISAANALSVLISGKSLKDWDLDAMDMSAGVNIAAGASDDLADNMADAADSAKKLKQYTMGWDELNVLDSSSTGSGGAGASSGGVGGSGLGLDINSLWDESMLEALVGTTDELEGKIKNVLVAVLAVGTAFAAWKIGTAIFSGIQALTVSIESLAAASGIARSVSLFELLASVLLGAGGAVLFFKGMWDALIDGVSWKSLVEQLGGIAMMVTAINILFKNSPLAYTLSGVVALVGGVTLLYEAFTAMLSGEYGIEVIATALAGVALAALGVGLIFKSLTAGTIVGGIGLIATAAMLLYTNWDKVTEYFSDHTPQEMAKAAVENIKSFADGLLSKLPVIIDAATGIISVLLQTIGDMLPDVLDAGIEILTSIIDGIANNIGDVIATAVDVISTLISTLIEHLPEIIESGVKLLVAIVEGIMGALPQLIAAAVELIIALAGALIENIPEIVVAAGKILCAFIDGILDIGSSILDAALELVTALGEGIVDFIDKIIDAGAQLTQGFIDGLLSGIKGIATAAGKLATSAIDKLKEVLDINSPSKVAAQLGEYTGEGFAQGLTESTRDVTDASKSVAELAMDAFGGMFNMNSETDTNNDFATFGETMMDALRDGMQHNSGTMLRTLKSIASEIMAVMRRLVRDTQSAAEDIIDAARAARSAAASVGVETTSKTVSVKAKASGGTVPSAQLFIANESGPELVGSIGNTTTVMNNQQIVQAVATGVANAVSAVMNAQNNGSQAINLYLDGEKIYSNQQKIARNKGVKFNTGAFAR